MCEVVVLKCFLIQFPLISIEHEWALCFKSQDLKAKLFSRLFTGELLYQCAHPNKSFEP